MNRDFHTLTERLEHDPESETYRVTFDSETVTPSTAVATVMTEICEEERIQLEPLYEVVDGDALNQLVKGRGDGHPDRNLTVEFDYLDYRVSLQADGLLEIRPCLPKKEHHD